jgi:hypothetical protein
MVQTVLTVLTQTPPFRGSPHESGSVGDALEARAQSDGADAGVALETAGLPAGLARALTKHPFLLNVPTCPT